MTPTERDRVKADLQAYLAAHQINVHDLAGRMKAAGRKVDAKLLHRYLDRGLLVDDAILGIYRGFVENPAPMPPRGA